MSLPINTNEVQSILLTDGQWYDITAHSFEVGPFEVTEEATPLLSPGPAPLIPSTTGFVCQTYRGQALVWMKGPLTSIVALMCGPVTL